MVKLEPVAFHLMVCCTTIGHLMYGNAVAGLFVASAILFTIECIAFSRT